MFEYRGAREAERGFAERGSANQTRGRDAYEAAMAANEEGGVAARNAAAAAAAQQIMNEQERIMATRRAADIAAGSEQFRQAGFDAYQAQLADAVAAAQANIDAAPQGFFGAPTRFMNNLFLEGLGSRIGGRGSDAYDLFLSDQSLFSPVYGETGLLTGYRDNYGRLTGSDPFADAPGQGGDGPEVTGAVTDPVTDEKKCPDGYIFDEDLQACRLDTSAPVAAPLEPRSPARTYSLLDQAPDGLLEFQRRYGLPQQKMDFSLLT